MNATDVVGKVRYVKSPEEIECLRRSTEIAEAGVDELVSQARSGADVAVLYARVTGRMLRLGSEYYPLALSIGGQRYTNPPLGLRLQPGMQVDNETTAVWGAQVSQEDQPVLVGSLPDRYRSVIEMQRSAFDLGLRLLRPGTHLGELIDAINGLGGPHGVRTRILMHGRGFGDDGPLLTPRASGSQIRDLQIEEGNAFVWKPTAISEDGKYSFTWGGDVVVTNGGGEKLFKREHGLIEVPA
ncbi:MAG: M24 family metallopeptidase [Chloroflexi bacterium]|nr:M24 family metallopeptidase [Chloroflexota bacterium]